MIRSVVIGTAGHIDHGKTALVRALTGTDTDRLPEEKRRGITIDLGFASLETQAADGSPLRLSFIDVPGHRLFIRNMLAGAGGVDCALLVVSAEEGVKPQTEEHLAICSMLGITRGLTVISKADAVDASRLEQVTHSVRQFLRGSFLGGDAAAILPVSAYTGEGLPALQQHLIAIAARIPARDTEAAPRLAVDRAFVMKGFGPVVTGTLQSGTLAVGDTLALEPGQRAVRVRGLQTHGRSVESVPAGSRVAANLAGVEIADLHRGDTLVPPSTFTAVDTLDVEVALLAGSPPLKHRARVHFHAFTSESLATVSLFEYEPVESGGPRILRLKLNKPLLVIPGDRFVLRQLSPAATIGGGRVLDANPLARLPKAKAVVWLRQLKEKLPPEPLLLRVARRQTSGLSIHALAIETGNTPERIEELTNNMLEAGKLLRVPGDLLLTAEAVEAAEARILSCLQAKVQPQLEGRHTLSELKRQSDLATTVFQFVLDRLVRERKVEIHGEQVSLYGKTPKVADADGKRLAAIAELYANAGLAAPSLNEVAGKLNIEEADMRRLITLLLREKVLVRLGQESLYLHQGSLLKLQEQVRALRGQHMDVARFKQMTGLSRKYAIPLLEYLDREHVTRKQGEQRLVV